jgi:flap endonuclease-1
MGVKLGKLVVRTKLEYSQLIGRIIAVDAPNIIMSLLNFTHPLKGENTTNLILDRTQRPIYHLYGLLYRINFYYSKKIYPIFCFDGNDSPLKRLITKDQLKDFKFAQKWYKQAINNGNKVLAKQIALSKEYLWKNIIMESKQLLNALGIPYIDSPASAESQCAQLVKEKIAFCSVSQDFDSLLFGCPRMVHNLIKSRRRKIQGKWKYERIEPIEINLNMSLNKLGISLFQLVDMAILIGTDYFKGIQGIGPITAFKLINKHNNLENLIIQEKERYDFSQLTYRLISQIRKIFLLPEVLKNFTSFSWNYPLKNKIMELLCEQHYLNKDRVLKNVKKFISNYFKCNEHFKLNYGKPHQVQTTLEEIIRWRA